MVEIKKEKQKHFQVWEIYMDAWHLNEFDTFSECVNYICSSGSAEGIRITKLVGDELYSSD